MAVAKSASAKDSYYHKQVESENKFQRHILAQDRKYKEQISGEEKAYQKRLAIKDELYNKVLNDLDSDGRSKIAQNQKRFEQDFNRLYRKQEDDLQGLIGQKEQIVQKLREEMVQEYKLGQLKAEDDFYSFGSLTVNISEGDKNDYNVKIPVPKHEAKKITMTGQDREIKVQMERRYEFNKTEEQGRKNSINKIESYVSKIPVKDILASKSITRSYADGVLTFNIKKA